ncbi:MAG: septum formation initiator family protein [Bacteroidales bacterium]
MWQKILSILRNKYVLVFLAVFVWLLFFDNHSLILQWRIQQQLNELRQQKEFYQEEIRQDSMAIERLENDPDALERYAREKYMMKKEGEDVFIIVDDDDDEQD